jgi:hypothetical protein
MIYEKIAIELARACDGDLDEIFDAAEEDDLRSLSQLGMPESVIEFYREHSPIETLDIGNLRIWAIPQLLEENQNYSPGAEVHELGYIIIAGNRTGDLFCLDLGPGGDDDPPVVVRLPHDVQVGSQDRNLVEGQATAVSDSFDEFLEGVVKGDANG